MTPGPDGLPLGAPIDYNGVDGTTRRTMPATAEAP